MTTLAIAAASHPEDEFSPGELIHVTAAQIGESTVQAVNARDLHAFLEVGKDFSTWIKSRILQYGFAENIDFAAFGFAPLNGGAGNRGLRIEYAITLDMAKELAMVERNEKGKQARQYFIECERRAHAAGPDIATVLSNPAALRSVLLEYAEKNIALEAKVQEQAPKVQTYDAIVESDELLTVMEVAKLWGVSQNDVFDWLREAGYLMNGPKRSETRNMPYKKHVDAGLFQYKIKRHQQGKEIYIHCQPYITGKGLVYLQGKWNQRIPAAPITRSMMFAGPRQRFRN